MIHERIARLACDDRVAGYAYAAPWRTKPAYRHTVENSVYVGEGRTGHGLGRRLLETLLERCADVGVEQVIAVIADSGDPASIALHRTCGFIFIEAGRLRRVGHKHGRRLDTMFLQRGMAVGDDETL
jgi:phosphinothricin acetyltransferase